MGELRKQSRYWKYFANFAINKVIRTSMTTLIKKLITTAIVLVTIGISVQGQNKLGERRVYYLDATYSMISPSKLWTPVKNDLEKAINAIEDENTEIYVIAFGGNRGEELKTWHNYATDQGKKSIIAGFQSFVPQKNTMTYLHRPLNDFYSGKVASDKVTYCFLMTDGKDEYRADPNLFHNSLNQWGAKYGNSNVYGFYVMLNEEAKDDKIESIIDSQEHLWKVESADVNINLVRLDANAQFNVRSDNFIELPISGKTSGLSFAASFPENSGLIAKNCCVLDGKLRVYVDIDGNRSQMPDSFNQNLAVSMGNGGEFDFLVTNKVTVECSNKKERIVRTPADIQNFGDVKHFKKFWFVPAKISPAKQTISFEFNDDAISDPNTSAEFQFVDKKGNAVSPEDMIVTVNGTLLSDNILRVTPSEPNADIEIYFSDNAKKGKYKGTLRMVGGNLQRVNNFTCGDGDIDACLWSAKNVEPWNPLKLALAIIISTLLAMFLIWMLILKPVFYPRFGSIQKTFNVPGKEPIIIKFKGARMVVLAASHPKKQSGWNSFWTGKIIYKTHSAFDSPIEFKPSRGRRVLARITAGTYRMMPNPMPGVGSATIVKIKDNLKINVN